MKRKLPTKLEAEPLIDAVFELRFSCAFPASHILPGLLFSKLEGDKIIENLPVSQLPKNLRDADPNLQYQPLSRIQWDKFYINIGDQSISVGIKLPYPGWSNFKTAIINIVDIIKDSKIINSVDRYSLKCIDLIPSRDIKEQVSFINSSIMIANHKLEKEAFQIRIEIPKDNIINIVQIVSPAKVTLSPNDSREGIIIDIDTIFNEKSLTIDELFIDFDNKISTIHIINKEMFFDCLKKETIDFLGAIYE